MHTHPPRHDDCFAVRQAARHISQLYERHLSAVQITPTQFSIVSALAELEFVAMHASIRKPMLTFRLDGGEQITVPLKADVTSNNAVFNRELVLEGFGLGVLPAALVRDELASGKLVSLLDDFEIVDGAIEIRLAYSSRTLLPAKVRAFIEHAAEFFEA